MNTDTARHLANGLFQARKQGWRCSIVGATSASPIKPLGAAEIAAPDDFLTEIETTYHFLYWLSEPVKRLSIPAYAGMIDAQKWHELLNNLTAEQQKGLARALRHPDVSLLWTIDRLGARPHYAAPDHAPEAAEALVRAMEGYRLFQELTEGELAELRLRRAMAQV